MQQSAFVTGGTGLLGTNLVRELARQGWKVRVLCRSRDKVARVLDGIEVEPITGDMADVAGFKDSLKGCDALFHCAAYFREYYGAGEHRQKLEQINVRGTLDLMDAAESAGVGKVVYVSSAGVLGHSGRSATVDESSPYAFETSNLYFQSKIRAEQQLVGWLKSHRTPVVLVLPGWMFGPFDLAPTASGRLVQDFLARKIPAIIPGGASIVDARDVSGAMIRSVADGKPGERYIVAGRPASIEELARTLEQVTGVPAPRLKMNYAAAIVVAWLAQTAAALRGGQSLLTVSGIKTMREAMRHAISSAKAERELGATFRPLSETLRDEVNWFRGVQAPVHAA
jgi:dihydroflavonol-4-reductase